MHTIKYSKYPNNEVRVVHYYSTSRQEINPLGKKTAQDFSCPPPAPSPAAEEVCPGFPSLDISSDFDHPPTEKVKKRTKFGTNAKRTILRLGGAYDTVDSTPRNYVFLTGTIPGGTHDAFMAMAVHSPYVTHSIAKWLKRTAPSDYWFYVWELQRRGALHIHYCIHAPDPYIRDKILCGWHSKWESIIQEVGRKAAADMWLRTDGTYHRKGHSVLQAYAQTVSKSVAAYMAGYCGGSKDKHTLDKDSPYYPSRWWGCSRASTKLLRGLTQEIVVEHTNYRDARYEMQLHYERVLHDSPKAHHYPHKVGIGSTVVSYHPQDKGTDIWQGLTMSIHNPQYFPNACSWIRALNLYIQTWPLYFRSLKRHKEKPSQRLLQDCEDILSGGSLSRYTLHQGTLRTVRRMNSELSLNTMLRLNQGLTMSVFVPPIWMLTQIENNLRWNSHQWLNLESDLPVRLTDCWSLGHSSTTDPNGEGAVTGAANGSLSPPNPPSSEQLCLSLDSLASPPTR